MVREWFASNRPGEEFDCWFVVSEYQLRGSWGTRYDLRASYAGRNFSVPFNTSDDAEAGMIGHDRYLAAMLRDLARKMIRALESTPSGDRVEGGSVPTR